MVASKPIPSPSKEEKRPKPEAVDLAQRAGLIASFGFAFSGLFRTVRTQRNMKIHWVSGTAVMLVGMALPLSASSRSSLLFCTFLVLTMEVLNTALEAFVDLHVRQFAAKAMVAKDAAAAAVLVVAVGAVFILADVLLHQWDVVEANTDSVWRTVRFGVPLLFFLAWLLNQNGPRWRLLLPFSAAGTLLSYLSFHSQDIVFSIAGYLFVGGALLAKLGRDEKDV